jgi:phosphohistidine phosphatase
LTSGGDGGHPGGPGRELLLLRHAKSDWNAGAATDFDRPLNPRGRQDAPRLGKWLRAAGLVPDLVLASPARRARQTARRVCRALGYPRESIQWEPRLYEAGPGTLIGCLEALPGMPRRVLLVAHNPGLEELLRRLCGALEAPADGKLMPTAALARLGMPADWRRLESGCARLLDLVRPRDLPL